MKNSYIFRFYEMLIPDDVGLRAFLGFVRHESVEKGNQEIEKIYSDLKGVYTINVFGLKEKKDSTLLPKFYQ